MKGKINVYICPQNHKTVTIDKDEGVTPFMLLCKHEGCKQQGYNPLNVGEGVAEMARSSMYQVDQTLTPEWEWYKPSKQEAMDKQTRDYVKRGGLLLRRILNKT